MQHNLISTIQRNLVEEYTNGDGIITVDHFAPTKPGEGNGLLQTGLWYTIKAQYGCLTQLDIDVIQKITRECGHNYYDILWRSPWKKNLDDNQNHDDYWGWLAACYFAGINYPANFYAHCQIFNWCIDIQYPEEWNPRYYFRRFLGFAPFVKMCTMASNNPATITCLDKLEMALSIFWAALNISDSSGCMKDYCRIAVARRESALCQFVSSFWFWRVRRKYRTVGLSFKDYFKGMHHPLVQGDWR